MKQKTRSFATRYVLAFGILMLIADVILGVVILRQSESTLRGLINSNMVDVVETAAGIVDGDVLGALTPEDVDGEAFRDIEHKLTVFQNHEDIVYIYAVKQAGDGRYVFTVDPDPSDPGVFGEEIVVTDALVQAGKGVATVDSHPTADRWGHYYSAFSPVIDSKGNVAGIIGVDFDADWYDGIIRQHVVSIAVVTVLSVLIGGLIVFIITHNVRKRFMVLDAELSKLSSAVDRLMADAGAAPEKPEPGEGEADVDEIGKLANKIQALQKDMAAYDRYQKDQYFNDAVTGIPNLNFVQQFADEKTSRLWASQATPAVIYFDIRSMVSYNTEYGHSRGDELLRLTAQAIAAAFPEALVGRGEGDHFIVVDAYSDEIGEKAVHIDETVKRTAYGRTTGVQCAIVKLEPCMKAVEGVERARSTLKKIGDDLNVVYRLYNQEEDRDYQTGRYIVQHFDEAIQNGWIKVFYHPILRASTRKITIAEALARWVDPARGTISPGQFIPALSRYHLLHKLDLYMVEQICREYHERAAAGLPLIPVSVNFSAQDFDYVNVVDALNQTLEQYGVPRESIIVEITEQDLAQATDHFREQLRRIRESGYRLWLDDFGSGYSSLNVFSQFHIDRIKFDMDLVRHLDDNGGANRIIMKSIVDMCRQMGIHTLAEGIETEAQYQFLRDIDCEMVQGFYFFRPEPLEAAIRKKQDTGVVMPSETAEERMEICGRAAEEEG